MWTMLLPWLLKGSFAFAAFGHGIDLGTTQRCIGEGRCTELNPWLARYEDAVGFSAAKGIVAGGTGIVIYEMSKDYKGLAIGVNVTIGGAFTALGLHNQRVAGGSK